MNEKLLDVYFAGLFDGEASIGIYRHKTPSGIRLRPQIKINMADKDTIQAVAKHFGGNIGRYKTPPNCKPAWRWDAHFHKAINVLKRVRPYLITKADAADHVLATYIPKYKKGHHLRAR